MNEPDDLGESEATGFRQMAEWIELWIARQDPRAMACYGVGLSAVVIGTLLKCCQ